VTAAVRIYWGQNSKTGSISIHATITNVDDRRVFDLTTTVNPGTDLVNELRVADYRLDLPLTGLEASEYLLTLSATPTSGGATAIRKYVRFRVE
jgi:hypothetical protein